MSLHKKLWLAIIVMLFLVFAGTFLVSTQSARLYLEQQLHLKNADTATVLALALSQQGADKAQMEETISAQFDTDSYKFIELRDPAGKLMILRQGDQPASSAPDWFTSYIGLDVKDGVATVQDGSEPVGTLTLRSLSGSAYEHLWHATQIIALIFVLAMVISGLLAGYALKRFLKPLDDVVEQARAIGEQRFTAASAPDNPEFKPVVNALNETSARIKKAFGQEAKRIQKWQRDSHVDKITGLNNREPFLKEVAAVLKSDDENATGSLSLVRIGKLAQMNQLYGRGTMDSVLKDIGNALSKMTMQESRWSACRLNGSDFALLAPGARDATATAREVRTAIREVLEARSVDKGTILPAASTLYTHGDTVGKLLTRLDGALLANEREGESSISIAYEGDIQMQPVRQQIGHWRNILEKSLKDGNFTLDFYPLVDHNGELLHYEAPACLNWGGERLPAGQFLPWVNRLQLSLDLDKQVIDLALKSIGTTGYPTAVNLSVAAVVESDFMSWLVERLSTHREEARKLLVEVPEAIALKHLNNFTLFCGKVKSLGARVGIAHAGHQLSELGSLSKCGADFLMIDASFVRDIDDNAANQTLMGTLCSVGHTIGAQLYAEGVQSSAEWETLKELGVDGATGPAIELPQ
jgi:EAL domain-containing protein (putative c-di-GMP-specific phosphodiesterase class I)/GGDEF domain-containing protein